MKKTNLFKKDSVAIWFTVIAFLIGFIVLGTYYVTNTFDLLNSQTEDNLKEITKQSAQIVKNKVQRDSSTMKVIADSIMQDTEMTIDKKISVLKSEVNQYGFTRFGLADLSGDSVTTDGKKVNVFSRKYFQDALNGRASISDLLIDRISNDEPIVVYAVPIYRNSQVVQVLYAVDKASNIAKLTSTSIFNDSCYSYIVSEGGTILFHPYGPGATNYTENILGLTNQPNSKKTYEKLKNDFAQQNTGISLLNIKDESVYMGYSPVGISNWMFVTILPHNVVFAKSTQIIWRSVMVAVVVLFLFVLGAVYIAYIRKKSRAEINEIAYTDRVTGIWNYNKFMLECDKRLKNKSGKEYAIIYFDIDNFKVVNDVFGYEIGDEILIKIANELAKILNESQIFARLSNDYFAILTEYHNNPQELVDLVQLIKERINHITVGDNTAVNLSLPTGIYLIREDETDANKIVNKANLARDAAKSQGNTERYAFFDEDMRKNRSSERAICSDIQTALETNQFEVYYQAKFELEACSLVGYEALIRWNHPEKGLIRPDEFIPIAEKKGYIADIDRYVFEHVCLDIHNWMERGMQVVPVSFNLSRFELYQCDLLKFITQTMGQYQIPAKYLEAEITETATVGMTDYVQNVISDIRKLGIKVSMDDFGTGASSLSCLRIMPIDIVKLDKSFLNDVENDVGSRNVAKSVITLAKSLDLRIIAEGVETLMQAKFLADAGCDMVQGYYFAKPLKKTEAEQFMLKPPKNLHLRDQKENSEK
ncbi:MAG TPA: EAL domain-containing protein [Oscillospiraceae bacterium]|nr:EAL domain-containing protein [Oscillospiraceae bacterium]